MKRKEIVLIGKGSVITLVEAFIPGFYQAVVGDCIIAYLSRSDVLYICNLKTVEELIIEKFSEYEVFS